MLSCRAVCVVTLFSYSILGCCSLSLSLSRLLAFLDFGGLLIPLSHALSAPLNFLCLGALVVAAAKAGLTASMRSLYPREASLEVPFNSSRKMAVSVHKLQTPNQFADILLTDDGKVYTHVAVVKGAPDRVRRRRRVELGFGR